MAKMQSKYVCQSCGYESPRWLGHCSNCGGWNTFAEEIVPKIKQKKVRLEHATAMPLRINEVNMVDEQRTVTKMIEFNRVLGGGIIRGSVVLIGGDPGVGKSTLLLQIANSLNDQIVLFVSGEESPQQIKLRAERIGILDSSNIYLLPETNVKIVEELIEKVKPDLLIVDSIQTMYLPELESSPGTIGQVREATAMFTRLAKQKGIPIFLVGHITKEGVIAGPKVIEHMVDTVLQFEGDRHYAYRILRTIKNRFGSTDEIGVFQMRENGLQEVKNPSEVFLSERSIGTPGSSVVPSMEGTRPILIEVQALVTPSSYGVPQRNTTGFDYRRLNLLIAVLEKRVGILLGNNDVFVNIAGGIRIDEPAVDLGISVSIVSSMRDIQIDPQCVVVGEVGLGGEIRAVSHIEKRVQESAKLGFRRIILPKNNLEGVSREDEIELVGVENINEAIDAIVV